MDSKSVSLDKLYNSHYLGAWLRAAVCIFMWAYAYVAYLLKVIKANSIIGISASLCVLILMNPVLLWILRHIKKQHVAVAFSYLLNLIEILAYTAIIYFLGGIRALWLSPMYVVLIYFVGIAGPQHRAYIIAVLSGVAIAVAVVLEHIGFLPSQDPFLNTLMPARQQFTIVLTVGCYLLIAAFVSARSGSILRRSHRRLRAQNKELELSEKQLRQARQTLEKRVEERTAELRIVNEKLERDIARRERVEKALMASEEKYKGLVKHALAGIYEFDIETLKFTSVNDIMCQYTGYSEAEFLELHPFEILSDDSQGTLRKLYEDILANQQEELSTEYNVRGKNNKEFPVMANARVYYEDGVPKRVMAVVHDLTDIRRAEEERRKLEFQLLNAKKLESLGTLAGGVAHDLNNILGGLVSYPDLLLMDLEPDSSLREPLESIKKSGERAAGLVQDLLTLARRGVSSCKVIDLNRLVRDFLKSGEYCSLLADHDHICIATELQDDVLPIQGSEVHLSKTLMNLVTNAVDAMPAGGKAMIATRNCYLDTGRSGYESIPEGEYTILEVADMGIGISEADLERIFEPFYTKKRMGRSGTGLGMSVVWGTIKDHKGYIDILTEEGSGTTFTLYFPTSRSGVQETAPIYIEDYLGKGESILIIDDSAEQRDIVKRMLQRIGYDVHTADSGQQAVSQVKTRSYDLLILDMIMPPGMDGLETYKRVLEVAPGQKAVIASGYAESERVREAQQLGAGSYIKKPFTLEKIGLAARAELDQKG